MQIVMVIVGSTEDEKKIFDIVELDEKSSSVSMVYDRIMQIAIVASILPLMFRSSNLLFTVIEYCVTILFLLIIF